MSDSLRQRLKQWLPNLDRRVWILAAGRLLSQVGIGFTLFYAPIFFTTQVGLTATQVGLG
ncbi:MAG: MFS transporter, partial [Leptolyngbya sp.]